MVRQAGSDGLFVKTDGTKEADVRAAVEQTVAARNSAVALKEFQEQGKK